MSNDIYHGIISGIIGPVIARWAERFKYRVIFLLAVTSVYVYTFFRVVKVHGWHLGVELYFQRMFTPTLILATIGAGLLAVGIVFVSSIATRNEKKR